MDELRADHTRQTDRYPLPPAPPSPVHKHRRRPKRRRAWAVGTVAAAAVLGAAAAWFHVASATRPAVPPPRPAGLAALKETDSSVTLGWKAQAGGTQPDAYEILVNSKVITSVPGSRTGYQVTGLSVRRGYAFSVIAVKGAMRSAQSALIFASTTEPPPPPLADAVFQYLGPVSYQETASSDALWQPVGAMFQGSWIVDPACGARVCEKVTVDGTIEGVHFDATLHRSGATYTGSAPINDYWLSCTNTSEHVPSTLSISVTATKEAFATGPSGTLMAYIVTVFNGTATWDVPGNGCAASHYQMKVNALSNAEA